MSFSNIIRVFTFTIYIITYLYPSLSFASRTITMVESVTEEMQLSLNIGRRITPQYSITIDRSMDDETAHLSIKRQISDEEESSLYEEKISRDKFSANSVDVADISTAKGFLRELPGLGTFISGFDGSLALLGRWSGSELQHNLQIISQGAVGISNLAIANLSIKANRVNLFNTIQSDSLSIESNFLENSGDVKVNTGKISLTEYFTNISEMRASSVDSFQINTPSGENFGNVDNINLNIGDSFINNGIISDSRVSGLGNLVNRRVWSNEQKSYWKWRATDA